MTTGLPKTRLSEKLNTELEAIRAEHAALMQSSLVNFRRDMNSTLNAAQITINSDMNQFLMQTSSALKQNKRILRRSPLMVLTACLAMLGLIMATSYAMARIERQMHLTAWGIQTVNHKGETYLLLEPTQAIMQSCTMAGRVMGCILIRGD